MLTTSVTAALTTLDSLKQRQVTVANADGTFSTMMAPLTYDVSFYDMAGGNALGATTVMVS